MDHAPHPATLRKQQDRRLAPTTWLAPFTLTIFEPYLSFLVHCASGTGLRLPHHKRSREPRTYRMIVQYSKPCAKGKRQPFFGFPQRETEKP
jgi:hypothetical protein